MKKILISTLILLAASYANAQSPDPFREDARLYELVSTSRFLGTILVYSISILFLIKLILDYRIKEKLIEKGASEAVISQLLPSADKGGNNVNIKWFFIFAGLGIGLGLVYLSRPIGIHSLAVMSLCISVSFLGYYLFVRRNQ
jgi:hypothetical protein